MPEVSAWYVIGPVISMAIMVWTGTRLIHKYRDVIAENDDFKTKIARIRERDTQEMVLDAAATERARAGGDDTLPLPIADAEVVIVVIDRVPGEGADFMLNVTQPVIWMHPRLQRSWRYDREEDNWVENTLPDDGDGINHLVCATQSDVLTYCTTTHSPGVHRALELIGGGEADPEQIADLLLGMTPAALRVMDSAVGNHDWIEAHAQATRQVTQVQPVATGGMDNPFQARRRPVIVDDEPEQNG